MVLQRRTTVILSPSVISPDALDAGTRALEGKVPDDQAELLAALVVEAASPLLRGQWMSARQDLYDELQRRIVIRDDVVHAVEVYLGSRRVGSAALIENALDRLTAAYEMFEQERELHG